MGEEERMERPGHFAAQRRPCVGRRRVREESVERMARTWERGMDGEDELDWGNVQGR